MVLLTNSLHTHIRPPTVRDASEVWQLAQRAPRLDANTPYTYLLLCSHFAETSLVATEGDEVLGFVMGYRPPSRPEAVFVWQIAVRADCRGRGLGGKLLVALVAQPAAADAQYLEATVTPSNVASERVFEKFAERLHCGCLRSPHFSAELFHPVEHEAEHLLRIGPIPRPLPEGDPA